AAMATALTRAGARTIVVGLNIDKGEAAAESIAGSHGDVEFVSADATNAGDLSGIVDKLVAEQRRCDVLINGAGINAPTPFLDITDEEWERIFNVNLRSVRLACQIFGRHMLETGTRGSIINIASMSAITPLSRVFTYSASKAAVLNLTQNLAREWAPQGIRVNAISPGFFPAEQNRKVLTQDRVENILRHTPMNRFGESHELAGAVLLLASEAAGSFVTGANLIVDGGFSAMTI
ncbi:MAG: SDR family oxidoreductase, partial [Planctomycetaceae bacterium]|nr:SDR family oxidoreductase [Planctomycetaceae bacterium]